MVAPGGRGVTAPDVLVVGAGPTGLALALQAHDHGARVRVVERRTEVFRPSRALMLHVRTLELLRPLGVTGELLARADTAPEARLHLGRRVVPVRLAGLDLPDTAFPHLTFVRQADVESVLADALAERGVGVERGTELVDVTDLGPVARARLATPASTEEVDCPAVAGCDGVESTVRARARIGWRGGTYDREVVLADVDGTGPLAPGVAHVVAGRRGLLFLFALGEGAPWRLLATRPVTAPALPPGRPGPRVPREVLQALVDEAGLPFRVTDVPWSSAVRLQHRVATTFRRGRLFLAGDAAHASSPAGGQGMNTGLHDAAGLGWRLALAPGSRDPDLLLGSYDAERRPAAHRVLALTHLLFWAESGTGPVPSALRGSLAPLAAPAVPLVLGRRRLVAEAFRVLAQLRAGARGSPLSAEGAARRTRGPRAGDRLPDAAVVRDGRERRLHELLARPGVHVLLDRDAPVPGSAVAGPRVSVHRLDRPGAGLVAVRPDGLVGYRSARVDADELGDWLSLVGAGPAPRVGAERSAAGAAPADG
ncbi:FAD-binding protein [Geodermatophilus marinus]|nr:FAD-binding protein [Geodermatophilus sp. LHW52908]